jgi:hypothetical protein
MSRDEARGLLKAKAWGPPKDGAWRSAFSRLMASLERKGLIEFDSNDDLRVTA